MANEITHIKVRKVDNGWIVTSNQRDSHGRIANGEMEVVTCVADLLGVDGRPFSEEDWQALKLVQKLREVVATAFQDKEEPCSSM